MFDEFKMTSMILKFFPLGQKVLKRLRYSFEIVALYCFFFVRYLSAGPPALQFFCEIVKFSREFKLKSVFKEIEYFQATRNIDHYSLAKSSAPA